MLDEAAIRAEVTEAYDRYLAAFTANDLNAINRLVQYPMAHIADGEVEITDRFPFNPAELKRSKQWHRTVDAEVEVVAASETKAHVLLRNAKRLRADDSLIETA